MFHQEDGQRPNSRLCPLSVLVFHHTVVLLLLTHGSEGELQVIGPHQPIVAVVGDDIILPCHLEPAMDVASTAVEWSRPDLTPRFVHVWRSGHELLDEQHPSYRGRTSVFTDGLKHGDISLKISRVKLSDQGTYRCFIPLLNRDSTVKLVFGSVSSPEVEISKVSGGVLLECKSAGWYPEPEVLWLDGEGKLLPAGPTETVRGPDDLCTVSSRVTVEKRHSNSFTCRVQQRDINQTRETTIYLPAYLFMVQSSSAARAIICLVVSIMPVLAVVFVVWKWGKNTKETTDNSIELQQLMVGEGHGERLMTEREKIIYLDNTKAKLDEELRKTEKELEHVKQVFETLTNQKKDLKNQTEKLISLLQEDKMQIEKYENKLKEPSTHGKDSKKQKREKAKQDAEKRKREHDALSQNTQKLLETAEQMIIQMSERKGKLEKDKEQIDKNLEVTERQRRLVSEREEETKEETKEEIKEEIKDTASNDPS